MAREYVRLEHRWPEHAKVTSVSLDARWLYIAALCYCSRNETDGFIPRSALVSISGMPERKAIAAADALVAAIPPGHQHGMFERRGDDYAMHDYLDHQKSRAEIEEYREKERRRKKPDSANLPRGKNAESVRNPDGKDAESARIPHGFRVPDTDTDTDDLTTTTTAGARSRVVELYEGMGWTINAGIAETLAGLEAAPVEWVEDAFRAAAERRARNVRYVVAVVDHWRDHGRDCECGLKGGANGQTRSSGSDAEGGRGKTGAPRGRRKSGYVYPH